MGRVAALALLAAAGAAGCAVQRLGPEEISPGLLLSGRVRLVPGIYRLPDQAGTGALQLAPGTRLDLTGVTLAGGPADAEPDRFAGTGLAIEDARGVRVTGGRIRGYKLGLRATRADGLEVEGCDFSGNFRQRLGSSPAQEDPEDWLWPHFNEHGEWADRYGAAILVEDSRGVSLRGCRGRDGQNGILLVQVADSVVAGNDFSFLSGWGLALYRSSDNRVQDNHFDFCVRGYSHGVYQRGQDSAGILVFEQCQRNRFLANTATYGGDGFFLYAGEESLRKTGRGGSNDNVVAGNDFSHAVANGIEATFSSGNFFARNRLDDCNYGVWAGYSRRSWFVENAVAGCRIAGLAIEHGSFNLVQGNRFAGTPVGVRLWWDPDEELAATVWGRRNDLRSHGNWVSGNRYAECGAGLLQEETSPPEGPPPPWSAEDFLRPGEPASFPPAPESGAPAGMQRIRMGAWGPLPAEPEYSRGAGAAGGGRPRARIGAP